MAAKPFRNWGLAGLIAAVGLCLLCLAGRAMAWQQPDSGAFENLLNEFSVFAEASRESMQVPGMAMAVIYQGEVAYASGFGVRGQDSPQAVDLDTVFQIGSTSKAFTSTMLSSLADRGLFDWQAPVTSYLPDYALYSQQATDAASLDILLTQRTGLPAYCGDVEMYLGFERDHYLESLRYFEPESSFGSTYAYQNSTFITASAVAEAASGLDWQQALEQHILTPLGMTSTSATLEEFKASSNRAQLHRKVDGQVQAMPEDWFYDDVIYRYQGAGAINASIRDMAQWVQFNLGEGDWYGRELVSSQGMDFLRTSQAAMGEGLFSQEAYYGRGWISESYAGQTVLWHNGGTLGMKSMVAMVPESGLGMVVLANVNDTQLPEYLAWKFWQSFYGDEETSSASMAGLQVGALDLATGDAVQASAAQDRDLSAYTGVYYNQVYENLTVSLDSENGLYMTLGPKEVRLDLTPYEDDVFLVSWPGLAPQAGGAVFGPSASGVMETLTVDTFSQGGAGVFTRVGP